MPDPSVIVERDVEVPMRDGVVLRADLYRPVEGSHPTLVMRTPYSKDTLFGLMVVLNPLRAATAGYSVLIQDVRGRFRSEGEFVPFLNEGRDGYDTVEWAAAQPWSTGRVGMYGSSYMAATQLQAAALAPPHLAAICPMEGSADYYEGRSYRGDAFELGALLSIALYALGVGSVQRAGLSGDDFRVAWRQIKGMLDDLPGACSTTPLTGLRDTVLGTYMPFFFDWLEHDGPGEFWDELSVILKHDRFSVPALHVSSWYDSFALGTLANFSGLQADAATEEARANQRMWLGPWGHYMPRSLMYGAARLGDVDFGLNAMVDLDAVQLDWFDQWLKDQPASARFRSPVRYYLMGANAWRETTAWPPPETQTVPLYLGTGSHGGELAPRLRDASEPTSYSADPNDPVPTLGGAHVMLDSVYPQGPWDQRSIEARSDVALFTSAAQIADVDIVGDVDVEVWVSSTAPSVDVACTLTVVRIDGASINLVDGIRRVRLDGPDPTPVRVELGPIAQRLVPGERLRLRVAGSNFPRFDLNPHTGVRPIEATERVRADQMIHHDADHPSAVHLPVLAGELAR